MINTKSPVSNISFGLWEVLNRTRQVISSLRRRELNKFGITLRESMVIRTVLRLGHKATLTAIANETHFNLSTMSEQLTRMEKRGLIQRVNDLNRKNKMRIAITDKGLEMYSAIKKRASIENVMSVLSEKEKCELWRLLSKIRGQALIQLGVDIESVYPPLDPNNGLWADDYIL